MKVDMKILHVISSMDPATGGVCQAVRSIIKGLNQEYPSLTNTVVCCDPENSEYQKSDQFSLVLTGPCKTSWSYTPNLKRWLKTNISDYDVIIVHGLWQYQTYAVYRAWTRLQVPPKLFVMPHGMLDPYFQKAKDRRLKAIRNIIVWKFIERKLLNSADGILFTCEEEKLLARKTFTPYHPKKEIVVGLGVETPPPFQNNMNKVFIENCIGWDGKPFLLFLSRIHEKKGIDMLVEAYLRIKTEREGIPQLVIAGPGLETQYGQHIKDITKGEKDILFPGMLSGDAKWGAFYNCEAFILPSHQENFGIAIVEALACRKAVLITDKVNIWREIEGNGGGLVYSDSEEETYKMLKKWLHLSTEKKGVMGEHAKDTYYKYYSVEQAAKQMFIALNN